MAVGSAWSLHLFYLTLFYIVPNNNTTSTRLDVPSIVRMMLAPVCALVCLIVPSKLQRIFVTFFRTTFPPASIGTLEVTVTGTNADFQKTVYLGDSVNRGSPHS